MTPRRPKILIVSDPPAAPGYLPRVRYLCDYLVRKGYSVTLLTEAYQDLPFSHTYPIETIRMYSGGNFDWFVKAVWTLLTDWHNRVFAKKILSGLSDQYDMVLCTSFSDFPLGAGLCIARELNIPLLCDIRDLDEQVDQSRYQYHHQSQWLMPFRRVYRAVHILRRNRVLRAADAITTVSPWHADFIRRFNPNVHIIYNGFNAEQFYPKDTPADRFRIAYIGSLFEWQKAGLEQVKEVIASMHEDILLDIHTPQEQPVAHEHLGAAIQRSSIMLVLTSPSTHGMLTTKFYEALGCAKPVLCVPSDKGALAELIAYTHAGIATDDHEQIKAFISDKYHEWQQQGFTRQAVLHHEEFSRETQCHHMEQVILDLLHTRHD